MDEPLTCPACGEPIWPNDDMTLMTREVTEEGTEDIEVEGPVPVHQGCEDLFREKFE